MPQSIYVGIKGGVVALDRATGDEIWSTPLLGSEFVTLLVDGETILAGTRGEIFCLERQSGRLLWSNKLPGRGLGLMSIATESGSSGSVPAEADREQQVAASD